MNIPLVLICNTYLTQIASSILQSESCIRTLLAILYGFEQDDGVYCRIRAYFLYAFVGNGMYSFVVQAVFQLVRIVFYYKRSLQTFRVILFAIIFHWLFVLLINLVFFPLKDFVYVSSEHRCLISYSNTSASILIFVFTFLIPTNILCTIHMFIFRHIRQTNQANVNRQFSRQRDFTVLKRILFLFFGLQSFSTPLAIIWIIYIITGYLVSWVYQLEALIVGLMQLYVTLFITFSTPQIRRKFTWQRCRRQQQRVHPIVERNIQPKDIVREIQIQRF